MRRDDQCLVTIRAKGFAPQEIELDGAERPGASALRIALEPGHRIRGRVIDEAGRPISGCRVYFAEGENGFNSIGGRLTTDVAGRFESDSLPARCPFLFSAKGYSSKAEQKLTLDGEAEVIVTLEAIAAIRGRVVDAESGKPVESFNVRLAFPTRSEPDDLPVRGISTTRMNPGEDFQPADGRFVLNDLDNGSAFDLLIRARGYQPLRVVHAKAVKAGDPLAVRLEPFKPGDLVRVAGRILHADGTSAAGTQVRLMGWEPDAPEQASPKMFNWVVVTTDSLQSYAAEFRRAVTDEQGGFSFADVPKRLLLQLAYWSDTVPATKLDDLEQMSPDELAALTLVADKPVTIKGKIDRTAFPDAASVEGGGDFKTRIQRQQTLTPEQTGFELSGLQAGKFQVLLQGKPEPIKGGGGGFTIHTIGSVEVNATPGETIEIEFGPERGASGSDHDRIQLAQSIYAGSSAPARVRGVSSKT